MKPNLSSILSKVIQFHGILSLHESINLTLFFLLINHFSIKARFEKFWFIIIFIFIHFMVFSCHLKIWSAIQEGLDITKILRNISGRDCKSEAIIIDIQLLIEKDSQYCRCFGRKVSYLNTSHASTWGRLEGTEDCCLPLRHRVFILLFGLFPLINFGFNGFGGAIRHSKFTSNLINWCIGRFWEQKDSLQGYVFNVHVMLNHPKWTDRVHYISHKFNLFERNGIVRAGHN